MATEDTPLLPEGAEGAPARGVEGGALDLTLAEVNGVLFLRMRAMAGGNEKRKGEKREGEELMYNEFLHLSKFKIRKLWRVTT